MALGKHSDDGDFTLESPDLTPLQRIRRLTSETYDHKISVYCQRYGRRLEDGSTRALDRKTVERWIRAGREVTPGPDLPPLDSPELMGEWYRRTFDRQVPEVLLALEEKKEGAAPAIRPPGTVSAPPRESEAAAEEAALESFRAAVKAADADALGFEAALERARVAERLAFHQWQVVLEKPEQYPESVIGKRKKSWEDAMTVLLRAEASAEKALDQSTEWGRWADIEAKLVEKLSIMERGMRSLFTRAATKVTLPAAVFAPLDQAYQSEVDKLFGTAAAGNYVPLLELE